MGDLHLPLSEAFKQEDKNTIRRKLIYLVDHPLIEILLVVLSLIDCGFVIILFILGKFFNFDVKFIPEMAAQNCCYWKNASISFHYLGMISNCITIFFAIDIFLKIILMPCQFISHPGEVADLIVVLVNGTIKFLLTSKRHVWVGGVIVLRCWR